MHNKITIPQLLTRSMLLVALLLWGERVQAQSALDLSVSPPTAYLMLQPTGAGTHTVTLENNSTQPITVRATVRDFSSDGKSGLPQLHPSLTFPYFTEPIDQLPTLTIAPKSKAQLQLHMSVPSGVPNREYPMTILFETVSQPGSMHMPDTGAQISGSIGSNLIVLVSDTATPAVDLRIADIGVSRVVDSFRPITFKPVARNDGYAAVIASGSARITNWQGKTLASFPLKQITILGSSSRELEVASSDETISAPFYYKALFLLGVYTVTIALETPNTEVPVLVQQSEKVVALPFVVIAILISTAVALYAYSLHSSRKE